MNKSFLFAGSMLATSTSIKDSITSRSRPLRRSVKKVFLKISQNSQESTCITVSFLITLQARRLQQLCFPVNFAKFLITPIYIEHLWWLLLKRNMTAEKEIWNFENMWTIPTKSWYFLRYDPKKIPTKMDHITFPNIKLSNTLNYLFQVKNCFYNNSTVKWGSMFQDLCFSNFTDHKKQNLRFYSSNIAFQQYWSSEKNLFRTKIWTSKFLNIRSSRPKVPCKKRCS